MPSELTLRASLAIPPADSPVITPLLSHTRISIMPALYCESPHSEPTMPPDHCPFTSASFLQLVTLIFPYEMLFKKVPAMPPDNEPSIVAFSLF